MREKDWNIIGFALCLFLVGMIFRVVAGQSVKQQISEPFVVASHSQEDVYNEHMLNNCLQQLHDLKGGGNDVK